MPTIRDITQSTSNKMKAAVEHFQSEIATLRAGRATPALLEKVSVDYYGSSTPLQQLANISAPEPRMLLVKPYDQSSLDDIERGILKADLGLTPNNDGDVIRINIPQLNEERRKELVRKLRQMGEAQRVAVRNLRREGNDQLKSLENDGDISEDDYRRALDEVQDLTDKYIKHIDEILEAKEQEIMEV